ncbi:MAG: tRNA (adenosine(37)-N6)-threonylcarbamoyltransferase complex ATPase subunit type 1 TsaE [Trebonia sp.]
MSEVSLTIATGGEMRSLGRSLATVLRAGDLVLLSGGLGAGKTTLTKGIGDGLGVRGPITSPTFVIARVHPPVGPAAPSGELRPALVHADAYRLGSVLELDDLDLDTDTASSVTVVEWGGGLAEGLATDRLEITITPVKADARAVDESVIGDAADGGNEAVRAGDPDDPTLDAPRAVRISAVGERWEGIKLPLASLADRL